MVEVLAEVNRFLSLGRGICVEPDDRLWLKVVETNLLIFLNILRSNII